MKQFFKLLLKLIIVALVLLVIGIGFLIGNILISNRSAREKIDQELVSVDQMFSVIRTPTTSSTRYKDLLPENIGSYQRGDISRSDEGCADWYISGATLCFWATYTSSVRSSQVPDFPFWVRVNVWEKTDQSPNDIDQMVGGSSCAAEVGGQILVRKNGKMPYGYQECGAYFSLFSALNGIFWQNSDWFIGVQGAYQNFIPDYPY